MKQISIITTALLDMQGKDFLLGGNERYLKDIIDLYEDMGFRCNVIQPSKIDFEKNITSQTVVKGIEFEKIDINAYIKLNKIFNSMQDDDSISHYQSYTLAYPKSKGKSIGISHGVYWDNPIKSTWEEEFKTRDIANNYIKKNLLKYRYHMAAKQIDYLVANDTNFINWCRSSWEDIPYKLRYIPNYVDLTVFNEDVKIPKDNIKVVFPRRLSTERGFNIALKAAKTIIDKYDNVSFLFTGEEPRDINIKGIFGKRIDKIEFKKASFDEMKNIYKESDICIIPTIFAEGTSLACLEAMAMGIPTIASNVGGLGNLIIDGFNGILINPNINELINSLEDLINDNRKRKKLSENGKEVANEFSKKVWREKWMKVVEEVANV